MFPTVEIGGRLARNARFGAPPCLVSSLWFSGGFAYEGRYKISPFRRFSSKLSCRFAWQAWHFVTFQPVLYRVESVKIGGRLARNARFAAPACLISSLWFSCGLAVSMGEAPKPFLFEGFQLSKLEEVSHEMLVLLLPRASSRVSGFPVASPCLWGKLAELRWEGAIQHAGRRGNRGNSFGRASLGGSETACWTDRKPCK